MCFLLGPRADLQNQSNSKSYLTAISQLLPMLFVIVTTMYMFAVFVSFHLLPRVKMGIFAKKVEMVLFVTLFFLNIIAFARAHSTHPGTIPEEPEWCESNNSGDNDSGHKKGDTKEIKRSGQRRHCKWCEKYKPDRTHHCRACRECILKMDHHCPWLDNCVGWHNHKYFLLVVYYSAALSLWLASSLFQDTLDSTMIGIEYWKMVVFLSTETLGVFLAIILMIFSGFHTWLFLNGLTTIEFCEKSLHKTFQSRYSHGIIQDLYNNLGPHWYLWLLPLYPPEGDGCHFDGQSDRKPLKAVQHTDWDDVEKNYGTHAKI